MDYRQGDEIEVVIDREGLGVDQGVGHLPDNTLVVIVGAAGKVGQSVQATIVAVERTPLGASILANAKS
ncbi:MAG: hypothetical protein QHI38_00130 [Armatimonadota bacterium]|nr:hypothetical protein [Armatimonadota bacterium]